MPYTSQRGIWTHDRVDSLCYIYLDHFLKVLSLFAVLHIQVLGYYIKPEAKTKTVLLVHSGMFIVVSQA